MRRRRGSGWCAWLVAALGVLFALPATAPGAETPPLVETGSATHFPADGFPDGIAQLNGTVAGFGTQLTECYFEFGTTTAYGMRAEAFGESCNPEFASAGEEPVAVAGKILNPSPNTVYHYRLVARNASGLGTGLDRTIAIGGGLPPDDPGQGSDGPAPPPSDPAPPADPTDSGCAPITLIGVRGSDEPEGTFGKPVGAFARALARRLGLRLDFGSLRPVPLFYPAPPGAAILDPIHGTTRLGQTGYSHSIAVGEKRLQEVFRFDRCRQQTRYVLAGYSQGAQVIGDAIEDHKLGWDKARILATVLFGDPKFDARLRDVAFFGARSKQGVLGGRSKRNGQGRDVFAGYHVASYCRRLDPFCQGDKRRIAEGIVAKGQYAPHEGYPGVEAQEAAKRVAAEWRRR